MKKRDFIVFAFGVLFSASIFCLYSFKSVEQGECINIMAPFLLPYPADLYESKYMNDTEKFIKALEKANYDVGRVDFNKNKFYAKTKDGIYLITFRTRFVRD